MIILKQKKISTIGILGIIAGGIALVSGITAVIVGNYFYNFSIKRKTKHKKISQVAKNADEEHPLSNKGDMRTEWIFEVPNKKISIKSNDGLTLWGRLFENPDENGECKKFGILCHGYRDRAVEMCFEAEKFYNKGYSILLPSARGHDDSEGNYIGMGWPERKDIVGWINKLNEMYDEPEIFLYGISMGGATVMYTVGEELPENVKCAIEDCGYSSINRQFSHSLEDMLKLPAAPIMRCANVYTRKRANLNVRKDGETKYTLSQTKIPMLFIHGTDDRYVPFEMLEENYNAHPGPKEKFIIEGGTHSSGPWEGGEEYWSKVFEFLDKYM